MPGTTKYQSQYRLTYDILKNDVNSKNKLLIAPTIIYSPLQPDLGFQFDLYFGENAIYMRQLPIKNEYNLKSLKEVMKDMNIRFIFLGKKTHLTLLKTNSYIGKKYYGWLKNDGISYSLEKDLDIIQAYIQSKGGLLINKNSFGEIYYLTGDKQIQKNTGLITNGSFEHWWKEFPMGEWKTVSGKISISREATEGVSSIRLEPTNADDKKGTRVTWIFRKPLYENGSKLRVRLDARAGESFKFVFLFTSKNGKWKRIKPGTVSYPGKGEWINLTGDFAITPDMKMLAFHLWLLPGAVEPAFVDNLSIELLK